MELKTFKNIKVEEKTHTLFEELRSYLRFKKGIIRTQDTMIHLLMNVFNKKDTMIPEKDTLIQKSKKLNEGYTSIIPELNK